MAERHDIDPLETQEWLDSLAAIIESEGTERAHYIIERLINLARKSGAYLPYNANTR
jgi:pyruvate dehydrogenase E1 component